MQHETILSYAKPFNKKMREQLVKTRKEKKIHASNFSTISVDDMKTTKKHKSVFAGIKILNNSQITTIFT